MSIRKSKIIGTNIDFRRITDYDLKILAKWRNTNGIREYNNQFILLNMIQQKDWLYRINSEDSDRDMFMITDKKDTPIGVCGLIHINKKDKSADVAIIIGKQQLHHKGLGSETLQMLIEYGFKRLNLHRIGAEIFSYNKISIRLFERLSFRCEATLRHALWRNHRWWNIHIFSLLKHEYIHTKQINK